MKLYIVQLLQGNTWIDIQKPVIRQLAFKKIKELQKQGVQLTQLRIKHC